MNIFYTPPEHIQGEQLELTGREAHHAGKVMRYREGDEITVVDGRGGRYRGKVARIDRELLQVRIEEKEELHPAKPERVLALGIIKKRDRMEFAVEKAVELGVSEIVLFRSRHTVKENVRIDRLEMSALSAMKQSLRAWLPDVRVMDSLERVVGHYKGHTPILAHGDSDIPVEQLPEKVCADDLLLLVGPEGGFSNEEVGRIIDKGGRKVSLGGHRLRAETAAIVLLSRLSPEVKGQSEDR